MAEVVHESNSHGAGEAAKVEAWRLRELLEAGYPLPLAEKIAVRHRGPAVVDLHEAIRLIRSGCTPALAAEILL